MAESTPRILVVDDSEQNLLLVELYLRGSGFTLETAGNGREALELLARSDFDLILLDVVMPGMGGIELCRRIKSDRRTSNVPVIFLTARMQSESDRLQAFAVGAVDYISKPIQRPELIARIRAMLRTHEVTRKLERDNRELNERLLQAGRAEESLLEQRDLLASLAEERGRQDPCLLRVDAELRIREVIGPASEILARPELGVLSLDGQRFDELLREPRAGDVLREVVGTGRAVRATTQRGAPVWIGRRAARADGGAWLTVRDVTSSQAIEERLAGLEAARPRTRAADGAGQDSAYRIAGYVGDSRPVRELTRQVDQLRQRFVTTLVFGESGTGKELIARALHFDGPFADRPFIPIHCGAIAPELIESELFGHEKGAFTGATQSKSGLFQAADGGTVFLDEIAETPPALQVKLLRVLQEGEIRPVGATRAQTVDVRIIAATNRDLRALVERREFREDLFYRLDVATLQLPPLRDRRSDVSLLVDHFREHFNARHGLADPVLGVSEGALRALEAYPWPGNVRELENVIERAFALGCHGMIQEKDLPDHIRRNRPRAMALPGEAAPPPSTVRAGDVGGGAALHDVGAGGRNGFVARAPGGGHEPGGVGPRPAAGRNAVRYEEFDAALRRHPGDRSAAMRALGMSRSTFYRVAQSLGIELQRYDRERYEGG